MSRQWFILRSPPDKYSSGVVTIDPAPSTYYRFADTGDVTANSRIALQLWPRKRSLKEDFFAPGEGFFCSQKLSALLQPFASCVLMVRATVTFHNGNAVPEPYDFMHVLHKLQAVDREQSAFKSFQNGMVRRVNKLVLKPDIPEQIHLFQLMDGDFYWPVVDESVHRCMTAAKLKNVEFIPVDAYRSVDVC